MNISWSDLFLPQQGPLAMFVRGTVIYWFVFLLLRMAGRREVGSLGVADLIVLLLVADAAGSSMSGDSDALLDGMTVVVTLVFWSFLADRARRGPSSVSHREPHMQQIPPSHIPPRPSPAPSGPPPGAPPVDPDTDDPDVGLPPAGPQQALVWTPRCAVRRTSAAGGDFPPQAPPEGADIPVMPGPGQEPPPAPPPGSDPATNQDPEQSRLPQERRTAP